MTTCEGDADAATKTTNKNRVEIAPKTYKYALLEDVHLSLPPPTSNGATFYTRGHFRYFHYGCDGTQDSGWGCGYRTLQTAVSWILNKRGDVGLHVPSIEEIQRMLVSINDKRQSFVGSLDWIGTLEEFYVIDLMFELPCKIMHVPQLNDEQVLAQISAYFEDYAGFIAMGGLSDTASKGIAGIHRGQSGSYLLIVDPHCAASPVSAQQLVEQGFVKWQNISEFPMGSYNLCFLLQR